MHSVERTVTRWRWSFYSVDLPVTYGHCALFTGVILRAGWGLWTLSESLPQLARMGAGSWSAVGRGVVGSWLCLAPGAELGAVFGGGGSLRRLAADSCAWGVLVVRCYFCGRSEKGSWWPAGSLAAGRIGAVCRRAGGLVGVESAVRHFGA